MSNEIKLLNLLDTLYSYIQEQGLEGDLLEWHEMYDNDPEELKEQLETRYNFLN